MNDLDTKNLEDKRVLLGLLLQAHNASINAENLRLKIKYWEMVYPYKPTFFLSSFNESLLEYIENLRKEMKEEREFLDYVYRTYCSDQSKHREAQELSQNTSKWN